MKRIFCLIFTFFGVSLFFCYDLSAQAEYGPVRAKYTRDIREYNGTVSSNGVYPDTETRLINIGKYQTIRKRVVFQWDIPESSIPDGSTISSVTVKFIYSISSTSGYSTNHLPAKFFNVGIDIVNPDCKSIWDVTDPSVPGSGIGTATGVGDPVNLGNYQEKIEVTFPGTSAMAGAISNALISDKFILGVAWEYESPSAGTCEWGVLSDCYLTVNFRPMEQLLTVDQRLSGGNSYGNIELHNGNIFQAYNAPQTFSLPINSVQFVRADTNKANIADEKFKCWNYDAAEVINHKVVTIKKDMGPLNAIFGQIGNATLKNTLEGVSSVSGDKISFKDPWLRDDNLDSKGLRNRGVDAKLNPFSSPLILSITNQRFKGVLLNQTVNALNPNYYSVQAKQTFDLFLPQTGKTHSFYFVDWTASNASVSNPRSLETPVIFTANNSEVLANYKGSQLSNTQTAFSNSSQRKFIMTPQANHSYGGDLHMVYESMGKIWYERSVDGGTTWTIENGGKPLNTDYVYTSGWQYTGSGSYTVAKHPSIDYYQDRVVILWQEQSGSNYVVRICFMQNGAHTGPANCIPFTTYGQYSEDIWPEIAVKEGGKAVIAIRRNDPYLKGLEIHYMTLYPEGGTAQEETSGWITGTDQNTGMFSLATDRSTSDKFHIAWQQNGTSSTIQYAKFNFTWVPGGDMAVSSSSLKESSALSEPGDPGYYVMNLLKTVNVSGSTGYTQSYSPSMFGVSDGTARLAFKGFKKAYYGGGGSYSISSCCPDNLSWIPYLRKYSDDVFSPQISQGSQTYFVAWTELLNGSYRTIATDASTLSNKETVDASFGRDIQINNGGLRTQQYSMGFNSESTSLPYSFKRSTALGDIQVNKKAPELNGRGIYLSKGESQVYFILGNITTGGEIINFTKAQDSVRLDGDLKKVNHYMTTEPFSLKENSKLTFAAICGTKDSSVTSSSMKNGQFAAFTLEMIDD